MITDENKYDVIDAYLLGLLNEDGRQEVEKKMADDPNFYTELVLQKALLTELDRLETDDTERLIDNLLAEETQITTPPDRPDLRPPARKLLIQIGRIRLTRGQVVASLILVLGLGWLGYRVADPPTVLTTIPYQKGVFGGFGTDSLINTYPLPVRFVQKLFGSSEYENGPSGLRLYLTSPPGDPTQWLITNDTITNRFRLRAPDGTIYMIQPDTAGDRKPLTK